MEGINRIQNYQIVKPIGSGGMSTVYMAVDDKLKRTVALKMLHPHLCNEPLAVERFRREALSAAKLDHPNIVRIYDYLIENNVHCIVMEYVPGLDIETIVKRRGQLDFKTAQYIMHKVAVALKAAHQQGLMHRDVKPSNILLHEDGRVMLSDFGLVKHSMDVSLTVDNAVAGTPAFMSPEQISGRKVNYSSDIYSWAVTFYYLLSGGLPYPAKEFAEIVYAIQAAKISLDKKYTDPLPSRYFELISRCLLANPEERVQNGHDLLKWLSASPPPEELDLVRLFELPRTASSDFLTQTISSTRVFHPAWFGKRKAALLAGLAVAIAGAAFLSYSLFARGREAAPLPAVAASMPAPADTTPAKKAAVEEKALLPARKKTVPNLNARKPASVDSQKTSVVAPVAATADSGKLFISVDTSWAYIFIDGKDMGQTPHPAIRLSAGRHGVRLTGPYIDEVEDSVTITADSVLRQRYKLKLKAAYTQPTARP
jgi:eukaryotic-like serine/threonine-protein kinase